jgi:hypothetical protein
MSAPTQHDAAIEPTGEQPDGQSGGERDAGGVLPVLAEEARVVRAQAVPGEVLPARDPQTMIPAVQAAAVAAGGLVAGAAVIGLVTRRQRRAVALSKGRSAGRRLARGRRRGTQSAASELVQIVGSRSLLVDVHLLGGRD